MLKELEQTYNRMVEIRNFSDASNIAFKIAQLMAREESGWYGCSRPECQSWMELGYMNAMKSNNSR